MLDQETKRKIDSARQILVGKVPDPKAQVDQITTALIYKFMDDMDREAEELGGKARFLTNGFEKYSWGKLMDPKLGNQGRLDLYAEAIAKMSQNSHLPQLFQGIFKDAFLPYRSPETLSLFLKEINGFSYDHSEDLGDAFEYLLSVMAAQGDAGQFRTPRHIIDFIVEVVAPKKDETILDPACGTAGFLISAYKHILKENSTLERGKGYVEKSLTPDERKNLMNNLAGYDISPDMVKLSLVNMYLHGFSEPKIFEYDTLSSEERWDESFDVIMANPPFMSPKGGIRPHKRFSVQANRSEVLFVDYILEHLNQKGRAGIIVPEGIIFQSANAYKKLRQLLIEDGLFAVVSLPAGVFNPYSGVKTSILFFDNELAKKAKDILFIKIENDGFDLGAQRRSIEKNDLPKALEIINKHKKSFDDKKVFLTGKDMRDRNIQLVSKQEIKESGDYNLTGDRYKTDIYVNLQKITQDIEKTFEPFRETIKQIQKQTEPYKKLAEQTQRQAEQMNRIFSSPMFQEAQESMQKVAKQMQKAFEDVDFQKIFEQQEKLQEELKKRQKWEMVKLGDEKYFKIESGGTPSSIKKEYWDGKINWATLADLPVENMIVPIEKTKRKITKLGLKNSSAKLLPSGTVLISSRATIGRVGIAINEIATNQGFKNVIIKDRTKVDPRFIAYMMTSLVDKMNSLASGGTFKEISKNTFSTLEIPLPDYFTQCKIVRQLDGYQKLIDGAKQVVESWKPNIKIDSEWETVKLGDVCEILNGYAFKSENYVNDGIRIIRITNVQKGKIVDNNPKFYPLNTKELIKNYELRENDLLISLTGNVGRIGMLPKYFLPAGLNQRVACLRNNKKVDKRFLFYLLNQDNFEKECIGSSVGIAQKNLSTVWLSNFKISLPSLKIQKQIVVEIKDEQKIVEANKILIKIFKEKTKEKIGEVWGN